MKWNIAPIAAGEFIKMNNFFLYPFDYKFFKPNKVLIINQCSEHLFLTSDEFFNMRNDINFCTSETIRKLKEKFFIVEKTKKNIVDRIIETKRLTKHSYLTNDALLLMVVPTLNCNCNCIYCQVTSQSQCAKDNNMSFKNLIHFCDFLFSLPHKEIKIEFQGGEPLLAFDSIRFIVERVNFLNRKRKKTIQYVICTNLLALTNKQIKFIKRHAIQISTSIDGPESVHNANRPSLMYSSTFGEAKKKINQLRKENIYPSALVTITNNNLNLMPQVVDEYIKLGFTGLFLRPLNNYGLAFKNHAIKYSNSEFMINYKKAVDYIIQLNFQGINIKEEYFTIILRKIYSAFNDGFVDMQNPCALGQMCMIVDQHGDVYPCDEARMISEMGDKEWKMGNIAEHDCFVNINTVQKRIRENGLIEENIHCKKCVYKMLCFTDPIREWYINKYSHDDYCGIRLEMFDYVFDKIMNASDEERQLFWEWAND